jgi:hypothetical protein
MSWILVLQLFGKAPLALAATSRLHCLELAEYVRTVKGYQSGVCLEVAVAVLPRLTK